MLAACSMLDSRQRGKTDRHGLLNPCEFISVSETADMTWFTRIVRPMRRIFSAAAQQGRCQEAEGVEKGSPSEASGASSRTAEYWNDNAGAHLCSQLHWENNEPVTTCQNIRISGDKKVFALQWFWRKYGPFRHVADLCSGNGILAKTLCSFPDFTGLVTGYDISPSSVELARKACQAVPNARFEVADLNTKVWDAASFDAVMANGALHHIEELDWCLGQIRRALRPAGLLYVNEYVGPQRFQWSDLQMRLANELLDSVPRHWVNRENVKRCQPEALEEVDPSEAVCSHLIQDTIQRYFHIVEMKPRGGTLLAPIISSGCLDSSIYESPEGLQRLASLAEREGALIDEGSLPADHVVIVARARDDAVLSSSSPARDETYPG